MCLYLLFFKVTWNTLNNHRPVCECYSHGCFICWCLFFLMAIPVPVTIGRNSPVNIYSHPLYFTLKEFANLRFRLVFKIIMAHFILLLLLRF